MKTTGILISLFFLAAACFFPIPAEAIEFSLREKTLHVTEETISSGRETVRARTGGFDFSPYAEVDRIDSPGVLISVGARIQGRFGFEEPATIAGGPFGWGSRVELRKKGKTLVDIRAVEIREDGRTLHLLKSPPVTEGAGTWAVNVDFKSFRNISILYHLSITVLSDDGSPRLSKIERTVVWPPNDYNFNLQSGIPIGTPPKPGTLEPLGRSPILFPDAPFVGDTFEVVAVFHNTGELATETAILDVVYTGRVISMALPPVGPGEVVKRITPFPSAEDETNVKVILDKKHWDLTVTPKRRPQLEVAITADKVFAEDPIPLTFKIRNTGSADAENAGVLLRGEGIETRVNFPVIPVGKQTVVNVSWPLAKPDTTSFTATVNLGDGRTFTTSLTLHRELTPRPEFVLREFRAGLNGISGEPLEASLTIANTGRSPGNFTGSIRIVSAETGETILSHDLSSKIAPGKEHTFTTPRIPAPPGLVQAEFQSEGLRKTIYRDFRPFLFYPAPEEALHKPVTQPNSFPFVSPSSGISFRYLPLDRPEEIGAGSRIVIPLQFWDAPQNRKPGRVTLSHAGRKTELDVDHGDTVIRYAFDKFDPARELTISLRPLSGAKLILRSTPLVIHTLTAKENGRIVDVFPTDTGLRVTLKNTAELAPGKTLALRGMVTGGIVLDTVVKIAPNETATVFLSHDFPGDGRRTWSVSLPKSAFPDSRSASRLYLTSPLPELSIAGYPAIERGKPGILVLIQSPQRDLHDVLIRDPQGSYVEEIPFLPAGETGVIFIPSATEAFLDYGPLSRTVSVKKTTTGAPVPLLLDTGGDTPISGRRTAVRFGFIAGSRATPSADFFFAVNGLLTRRVTLPALNAGQTFIGSVSFFAPADSQLEILMMPEPGNVPLSIARLTSAVIEDVDPSPTRAEWGWTVPVIHDPPSADTFPSVYLRLGRTAWRTAAFGAQRQAGTALLITPENTRRLDTLASDTSISGRIEYRRILEVVVNEWKTAFSTLISRGTILITVDEAHIKDLALIFDELERLAQSPVAVDRGEVERELGDLADNWEILIGVRLPDEIARMLES